MSESRSLLLESAERLFTSLRGDERFTDAWPQVSEFGFPGLLTPERDGGFGGDWGDAFAVMRLAGAQAVALPVGEAVVAARLCAEAKLDTGDGLTALAAGTEGGLDKAGRFTGRLLAAPWGREAGHVVFDVDGGVACVDVAEARITHGVNPAGEPRDVLAFEGARAQRGGGALSVLLAGAFVRTAQIAGALDAALALSIQYANERTQFGKPIGKFQAVQQALAVFAEEAAAVNCAGQAAARACDLGDAAFEIAAAKLRANSAAAIGASTAHQVHGAIGFTQEYPLQRLTKRLVSWRSEFGGEQLWAQRLGAEVCAQGADALWPFLTARGDAAEKEAR